jgi:hypothetical protein
MGPFSRASLPLDARHTLRVPVMLIHTAAHVRCLPAPLSSNRLDASASLRLKDAPVMCNFGQGGFPFEDGSSARPCGTRYHNGCFQLGAPFTSRLKDRRGLQFPRHLRRLETFICEACTARAVFQRELWYKGKALSLLTLERARLIDMINSWSDGTRTRYQSHLKYVSAFQDEF